MSKAAGLRRVLNVGGNSKEIPLPAVFAGFEHLMLDIDPATNPDICCDARQMHQLELGQFDAVYCSHNLEHYYRHDVKPVLHGFHHVLKPGGFVYAVVPDLLEVMKQVVARGLDIDDVLYECPAGPIMVFDVVYGYSAEIERRGIDFFAHKTGYSKKSLSAAMKRAGFSTVYAKSEELNITAIAFKDQPYPDYLALLGLPARQ